MRKSFNKKQSRRDFLISSVRKGFITGLGFIGISLGYKIPKTESKTKCPKNGTCRDCFKLGVCEEQIAALTRKEIKERIYIGKISKGANNG